MTASRFLIACALTLIILLLSRICSKNVEIVTPAPAPKRGDVIFPRNLAPLDTPSNSPPVALATAPNTSVSFVLEDCLLKPLEKFTNHKLSGKHAYGPRFAIDEESGLREGRIICFLDAEKAKGLLKQWALGTDNPIEKRRFALLLLREFAFTGHPDSKRVLLNIGANDNIREIRNSALHQLHSIDHEGIGKALYLERFNQGERNWATQALILWTDPERVAAIQRVNAPDGDQSLAKILIRHSDVLQAADRNERLIQMISEISELQWKWMPWALNAALANHTPGIKEALRIRLNENETLAVRARALRSKEGLPNINEPLDSQYIRGSGGDAIFDKHHDDALLAYWRLGGELTEREKKRLNYHGYLGDQTENLKSIR